MDLMLMVICAWPVSNNYRLQTCNIYKEKWNGMGCIELHCDKYHQSKKILLGFSRYLKAHTGTQNRTGGNQTGIITHSFFFIKSSRRVFKTWSPLHLHALAFEFESFDKSAGWYSCQESSKFQTNESTITFL